MRNFTSLTALKQHISSHQPVFTEGLTPRYQDRGKHHVRYGHATLNQRVVFTFSVHNPLSRNQSYHTIATASTCPSRLPSKSPLLPLRSAQRYSHIPTSPALQDPGPNAHPQFLDFTALPSYTKAFESITVLGQSKPGNQLQKGDKVSVKLAGSPAFTGVIEVPFPFLPNLSLSLSHISLAFHSNTLKHNLPESFAWTGSLPYVFTGTHSFSFAPSEAIPGGTTFTQEEVFSGLLGVLLMGDGVVGRAAGMKEKTRRGWEGFNADFKGVCEKETSGGKGGV